MDDRSWRALRWSLEAAFAVLLFSALLLNARSVTQVEPQHDAPMPALLPVGADLAARLGALTTLTGERVWPSWEGLRLWILVEDRECLSCLYDLPLWAAFMDSLTGRRGRSAAVALGDRYEARRTFYGSEPGMPVLVAGSADLPETVTGRTPIRILTWQGRVVTGLPEAILAAAAQISDGGQ